MHGLSARDLVLCLALVLGGSALMQLVQPTLQAWLGALGWCVAMRSYRVAESADRARAVVASSPSDL